MIVASTIEDIARRARTRFGDTAAGCNSEGAFVTIGDRIVHAKPDPDVERVAIWTELARPAHAPFAPIEKAALEYSARALLARGMVIGVSRPAGLIVLGRGIELEAMLADEGLDTVAAVAEAAAAAEKIVADAADERAGSLPVAEEAPARIETATAFKTFITRCAETLALPAPVVENSRYMFKVGDRWVELRHAPADDRVTFVSIAWIASPDETLRAEALCDFNLRSLFRGGCGLIPDIEGRFYLCRASRLALVDPARIATELADFARQATAAGSWGLGLSNAPTRPARFAERLEEFHIRT